MIKQEPYIISILVPIYGVEKYIERCARSLFEQSYEDIEYIFVDDCSPDRSIEILKQVIDDYPQRRSHVRIIRHKHNRGLAAARNTAVENCQTDFLMHVDSDDWIDRECVKKSMSKQKEGDYDIVLFDFMTLWNYGIETNHRVRCNSVKERTEKLLSRNINVCVWASIYRSSLYKENGIVAVEGVNNNEDYQITPRLSYYSKSFAYISECLYYYDRKNDNSITGKFSISNAEQGWKSIEILKDFFKDKGNEYIDAIEIASTNRLANYLKWSINANFRTYYDELRKKQEKYSLKEISTVDRSLRIYLYIRSYKFLYIYTFVGIRLKYLIKKHFYDVLLNTNL